MIMTTAQKVDGEALFETQPKCKDFIIEALKFHLASGDANKLASFGNSARTKPRQPIGLPKVQFTILFVHYTHYDLSGTG